MCWGVLPEPGYVTKQAVAPSDNEIHECAAAQYAQLSPCYGYGHTVRSQGYDSCISCGRISHEMPEDFVDCWSRTSSKGSQEASALKRVDGVRWCDEKCLSQVTPLRSTPAFYELTSGYSRKLDASFKSLTKATLFLSAYGNTYHHSQPSSTSDSIFNLGALQILLYVCMYAVHRWRACLPFMSSTYGSWPATASLPRRTSVVSTSATTCVLRRKSSHSSTMKASTRRRYSPSLSRYVTHRSVLCCSWQ